MAYIVKNSEGVDVTQAFRKKEYGGSSIYQTKLTIDGVVVPTNQIAKITISNPIIDTTSEIFYVGSFISQQITIKFKNLDGLNIASNKVVKLEIGTTIDGEVVYVPMGEYLIDTLAENYQTTCEITCLDYGVKFKRAVNYQDYMTEGKITLKEIVSAICQICGVTFDENYTWLNGDVVTGYVDSTKSGKEYISYIAELEGSNAKIGRDGVLYFQPLKSTPITSINALRSKTWELGERYEITHVTYFDGVPTLHTFPEDDTTTKLNELIIRQSNPFVTNKEIVRKVYERVKGTVLYTLKNENVGDITLDSWDNIKFTLGTDDDGNEISYTTINHNDLTFEQTIMTIINPKIPTKQQEIAVNVKKEPDDVFKRTIKSEIDTINGEINTTIENVNNNKSEITNIKESLDGLQLDFQKSGNNLVRNTMFYDFEGWSTMAEFNIARGETPPTGALSPQYWYCTKTSDLYDNGIVYQAVWGDTEPISWDKTDIKISNLEESFPPPSCWSIISNSDVRNRYLSGRTLHGIFDGSQTIIPTLHSDLFDIVTNKEEMTLSFKITTKPKNNGFAWIDVYLYEDTYTSPYYASQPVMTCGIDSSLENQLVKIKFNIPKSTNAISVYSSTTEPTDTSVLWLELHEPQSEYDTYWGELKQYDGTEWKKIVVKNMLRTQDEKLFMPEYQYNYINGEWIEAITYFGIGHNNDWKTNFVPSVGAISLGMGSENETDEIEWELGDLKLEYGEYSEWTPKRTEVIGLTHLLDETGYKIHSGDDEMRIMVDEIAQYYKDVKTFYINKTEGYFKDAICDTNNVSGLVTRTFDVGGKKIYGRYIQ